MQDSALNQSQQQAMDYLTKGLSFENQDEYKNAIDTYKQGLKTFPEEKNFHNRLARIYLNHNEKEKAVKHFSHYMKNNTDIEPESVLIYGNLLLDLHGTEKALEFYKGLDTTKLKCPEIDNLIHQLENNKIPQDDIEPGPGNTKFSTDTIANLFTFFSGRENNYAIQWVKDNKTGYAPANEPLGFQTAARHLNGEITLGIYQLNVASQVKWCVFDVDIKKILVDQREDEGKNVNFLLYQALTAAKELQSVITSRGLKSYIEFSGNKGYHVWIFFESFISAKKAKYLMNDLLKQADFGVLNSVISVEIFPKQSSLEKEKKLGSLVKLPYGLHKKTGKRSYFLDENDKPIPNPDDFFQSAEKNPLDLLKILSEVQEFKEPDQDFEISDMVKDSSITMSDKDFNLLISKCRILDFIVNKIIWEKECSDDEFAIVKHTVGHLKNGKQLVNELLMKLKNSNEALKLNKNLTGFPMGCKKIKHRVPDIAVRFDCKCKFSTDLKEYKHPILHIKEYELEQEELSQQRTEALKFQQHLEKFIETKKELKEKVDFVKSLEKYLNKYLDQKNIEELKTEFGVLRRIVHPNGDTSLVMEL